MEGAEGRFPREFIERVKSENDLVELASEYTRLKRSGKEYIGLCPFHTEKTPSFHINPELGLFHCFGCGKGGDLIKFIMEKENLSYTEAIVFLARRANIPIPKKERNIDTQTAEIFELYEFACDFFVRSLYSSNGKNALEYLFSRGVQKKTIEEFKLGFAPFSEDSLANAAMSKGFSKEALSLSGLFKTKDDKLVDIFWGRIIFPIFTPTGNVVAFGGRIFAKDDTRPKYINSPETKVYHKGNILYGLNMTKQAIREKEFCILVEGYMDLVSLYEKGIHNVVASSGTALTSTQASTLKRYTDKVYILYDGDTAGNIATIRAVKILIKNSLTPYIVRLPDSLDPDSFIRKRGKLELESLLNEAPQWFDYLASILTKKYPLSEPTNIPIWINKLTPFIAELDDNVSRFAYSAKLSKLTGVAQAEILIRASKQVTEIPKPITTTKTEIEPAKKRELLLFYTIFSGNAKIEPEHLLSHREYFVHYPGILELVALDLKRGENITREKIIEYFRDDPDACRVFAEFSFRNAVLPGIKEQLKDIQEFYFREKIKWIKNAIISARAKNDIEEENRLLAQLEKYTRMLSQNEPTY